MTPPATAAAAHRARPAVPSRRAAPTRAARRMSGALRPAPAGPALPRRPIAVPRPPAGARPLAEALGRRLRDLPEHRFLDRLIGGRVWIPLIACLLLGLVTMQVSMLKLNAGIGHAVERQSTLQRENASLRATNGRLSSDERVRSAALAAGLHDPTASSVRFLREGRNDARLAVARMIAPSALAASAAASATTPQVPATTPIVAAVPVATAPATTTPAATAAITTTPTTASATGTAPATTSTTTPTATTSGTTAPTTAPTTTYTAPTTTYTAPTTAYTPPAGTSQGTATSPGGATP
jgi:hypothetical protein